MIVGVYAGEESVHIGIAPSAKQVVDTAAFRVHSVVLQRIGNNGREGTHVRQT
jgi:hypothetical protein